MDNDQDTYGTTYREHMKRAMSEPAPKFRALNRRSSDYRTDLRLFLWCFVGILAGATAILLYDRLIQGLR